MEPPLLKEDDLITEGKPMGSADGRGFSSCGHGLADPLFATCQQPGPFGETSQVRPGLALGKSLHFSVLGFLICKGG